MGVGGGICGGCFVPIWIFLIHGVITLFSSQIDPPTHSETKRAPKGSSKHKGGICGSGRKDTLLDPHNYIREKSLQVMIRTEVPRIKGLRDDKPHWRGWDKRQRCPVFTEAFFPSQACWGLGRVVRGQEHKQRERQGKQYGSSPSVSTASPRLLHQHIFPQQRRGSKVIDIGLMVRSGLSTCTFFYLSVPSKQFLECLPGARPCQDLAWNSTQVPSHKDLKDQLNGHQSLPTVASAPKKRQFRPHNPHTREGLTAWRLHLFTTIV